MVKVFTDQSAPRTVEQKNAAIMRDAVRQFVDVAEHHIDGNPRWAEIYCRLSDVVKLATQMMHPEDRRAP